LLDLGDEVCGKIHGESLIVALERVDVGIKRRREAANDCLAVLKLAELCVEGRVSLPLDEASYRLVLGSRCRSSGSG
jgi:hypothetical protein